MSLATVTSQEGALPSHTSFQGFRIHRYILKDLRHFALGNPLGLPHGNVNALNQRVGQETQQKSSTRGRDRVSVTKMEIGGRQFDMIRGTAKVQILVPASQGRPGPELGRLRGGGGAASLHPAARTREPWAQRSKPTEVWEVWAKT